MKFYFSRSVEVQSSITGSDRSDDMKNEIGVRGFPLEPTLNRRGKKKVLAVAFHENAISRLNEEIKVFVTPSQYFEAKKIFNPDITEVKEIVNGIPNKIYSQGMRTRDVWEEVFRRSGRENRNRLLCWRYIWSFHQSQKYERQRSSQFRVDSGDYEEGVQLAIDRKASVSGKMKCHIFILSDAQLNIINREFESVTY